MALPSTPILDSFTRANEGPPPTGWTAWLSPGFLVNTNQLAPNDDQDNGAYYNTSLTGPDQEAYVTIATLPQTGGETAVMARCNPTGSLFNGDFYMVDHAVSAGTDTITIQKMVSSSVSTIGGPYNQNLNAGDKLCIQCVGTAIAAWVFTGGAWVLVGSVTDTSLTGASPQNKLGLYCYGGGGASTIGRWDDFGGGTIVGDAGSINYLAASHAGTPGRQFVT